MRRDAAFRLARFCSRRQCRRFAKHRAAGDIATVARRRLCLGKSERSREPREHFDDNYYVVESGVSPRQKTPHHYHAYNFNRLQALLPESLRAQLLPVFDSSRMLWNRLTGNDFGYEADSEGRKFHPQILHYPSGGGHFGRHIHPLQPQQIGLILGLSRRGEDFHSGCTRFEVDGVELETEDKHDISDLILFRYDIVHWIAPIDSGENLRENSDRGRWTLVLPYY